MSTDPTDVAVDPAAAPDPEPEDPGVTRRREFAIKRRDRLRAARTARLSALRSDRVSSSYGIATRSWSKHLEATRSTASGVPIRVGYIRREHDEDPQPPLAALASALGLPLRLHLTLLATAGVAQTRLGGGFSTSDLDIAAGGEEPSWATLSAVKVPGGRRGATRRVHEALEVLERRKLVARPRAGGWRGFTLLEEDRGGVRWGRPDPTSAIEIPLAFFAQGWHLILTEHEIAVYLAIHEISDRYPGPAATQGIGLPAVARSLYAMSRERYTEVRNLVEFGLIKQVSGPLHPQRTSGRSGTPSTAHYRLLPDGVMADARTKVMGELEARGLPYSQDDLSVLRMIQS